MVKEYTLGQYYTGSIDERYLPSKETNSTFVINIYLPSSYTDTQKKYPVMVLTDAIGQWVLHKPHLTFNFYKEIPEVIIVGIGYPYSNF